MIYTLAKETSITASGEATAVNLKAFNEVRSLNRMRIWVDLSAVGSIGTSITFEICGLIGTNGGEIPLFTVGPLREVETRTMLFEVPPQFVRVGWVVVGPTPSFDFEIEAEVVAGPV